MFISLGSGSLCQTSKMGVEFIIYVLYMYNTKLDPCYVSIWMIKIRLIKNKSFSMQMSFINVLSFVLYESEVYFFGKLARWS